MSGKQILTKRKFVYGAVTVVQVLTSASFAVAAGREPIPRHGAAPVVNLNGTYVPSPRLSEKPQQTVNFPLSPSTKTHDFKPQDLNCDMEKPVATSPSGRSQVYRCANVVKDMYGNDMKKEFFVFKSKGTFAEISYDHGFMFAGQIEEGVVDETLSIINNITDKGVVGTAVPISARSLIMCVTNKMFGSTSQEFQKGANAFIDGYLTTPRQGRLPKYTRDDLKLAAMGIELDNVLSSFENPQSPSAVKTFLGECGAELAIGLTGDILTSPFRLFFGGIFGRPSNKFGCTGFIFPGTKNSSGMGDVVQGRNLDADLTATIARAPVMFMHEEEKIVQERTGKDQAEIRTPYFKYVAAGSAGLMYPGGISGFNEKGISVSSHQMYPVAPKIAAAGNEPEIATMVQQHILREADSIDKAIEIAKRTQHYAAWAFAITDAKTRESATIEVSSDGVGVLRRQAGEIHTQTNHFRTEIKDSIFFPNVNKRTESENRLRIVTEDVQTWFGKDMSPGRDVQQGIEQLASHDSGEVASARRTVSWADGSAVKPYGVLSSIAVPTRNEFWMTTVDAIPAAHSTYIGFKIDWNQSKITKVAGARRATRYANDPQFLTSLNLYVRARNEYRRGTAAEALRYFTEAGGIAERMKKSQLKNDVPMLYVQARLHQELAQGLGMDATPAQLDNFFKAERLFTRILDLPETAMSPYQRGLVQKYAAINLQTALNLNKLFDNRRKEFFAARKIGDAPAAGFLTLPASMANGPTFEDLMQQLVGLRASQAAETFKAVQSQNPHFETELNIAELEKIITGSEVVKAGSIDFVIIR